MNKRAILCLIVVSCLIGGSFTSKFAPASKVKTVVIDPGHGGKDPGCHGHTHKEKDIALNVALKLGKYIETHFKEVKVVYTRTTDVFVELQERAAIANRNKADLFISIHCNSASYRDKKTKKIIENPDAHGSETYVMGIKNEQGKLEVAKRENSAMLLEEDYLHKYDGFDPNSDEAYIIMSLYTDTYLEQSLSIASKIQHQYKMKAGRNDKGVKRASLWVLWRTAMPSILTEIGFLTNAQEEKFLGSDIGQEYIAQSIFRAFRHYKTDIEGTNIKYNDEIENQVAYVPPPAVKDSLNTNDKPVDSLATKKETPQEIKKTEDTTSADNEKKKEDVEKKEKGKKEKAAAGDNGISFKVQFTTSPTAIAEKTFKSQGITDVSHYKEKKMYAYMSGNFTKPEEATKLQAKLRKKGYPDAFVVAFKDGKKIPYSEAVKLLSQADNGSARK